MQKEAADQENERKQHRNQIKQIWNFTADEQENLLHAYTPRIHTCMDDCMYAYINIYICMCAHLFTCLMCMCAQTSPSTNCLGAFGSVCQCLLWKQTE